MPSNYCKKHPSQPKIIWLNLFVFVASFLTAIIGVPVYAYYVGFDSATIIAAIVALCFCELSITAGYHRLWTHRAYRANPLIRFIFAIGGAFAMQNSIIHWSSDHRAHHKFVDDNERDPYSAKRGFWHSHIGWMLKEYQAERYTDYRNVRDLQRDPIVSWQHRHYLTLTLVTNFGFPLLFGWLNGDLWGSLLLIGVLRLVLSHHLTFCINSLAHLWGKQPYSDKNTAKDNALVALLTFGEGYHNFHHAFQFDYRNAIKWWQFDPTKWLIKTMSWLGLARDLKRVSEEKIQQSIATQQFNKARKRLLKLTTKERDAVLKNLQAEYELLLQRMQDFYRARRSWMAATRNQMLKNVEKSELLAQYQQLKDNWLAQRQCWQSMIQQYA